MWGKGKGFVDKQRKEGEEEKMADLWGAKGETDGERGGAAFVGQEEGRGQGAAGPTCIGCPPSAARLAASRSARTPGRTTSGRSTSCRRPPPS